MICIKLVLISIALKVFAYADQSRLKMIARVRVMT